MAARRIRYRGCAVVAVLMASIAIIGAAWILNEPRLSTLWATDRGTPVPKKFTYILFPATDQVILKDAGGSPVGFLQRAILVSEKELSAETIEVNLPTGPAYVLAKDITSARAEPDRQKLLAGLDDAVKSWQAMGETDWTALTTEWSPASDGGTRVTLRLKSAKSEDEYVYRVTNDGKPVAEKWSGKRIW